MSHHNHNHDHDHDHDQAHSLTIEEKLAKLFDHWVAHNESHAQSYRDWAKKAGQEGLPETAALLNNVADMSDRITEKMKTGKNIIAERR